MKIIDYPWKEITEYDIGKMPLSKEITLYDHIWGFDQHGRNRLLDRIQQQAQLTGKEYTVGLGVLPESHILSNYSELRLVADIESMKKFRYDMFQPYNSHPDLTFKNFTCSFNGGACWSRKMLLAILHKFNWYTPEYSSKNFAFTVDELDGHLQDYLDDRISFYLKFFIADTSVEFFQKINGFEYNQNKPGQSIYMLEKSLVNSFVHLVSESMSTFYTPYITEKFLTSIVTRGLFISWGQYRWHEHLTKYYGFKNYDRIFDYRFDQIPNPVERLDEIVSMLGKVSHLSSNDWRELYELEKDTIEFNYDHYFSGDYYRCLEQSAAKLAQY